MVAQEKLGEDLGLVHHQQEEVEVAVEGVKERRGQEAGKDVDGQGHGTGEEDFKTTI